MHVHQITDEITGEPIFDTRDGYKRYRVEIKSKTSSLVEYVNDIQWELPNLLDAYDMRDFYSIIIQTPEDYHS